MERVYKQSMLEYQETKMRYEEERNWRIEVENIRRKEREEDRLFHQEENRRREKDRDRKFELALASIQATVKLTEAILKK
jgi:hypothetical protein